MVVWAVMCREGWAGESFRRVDFGVKAVMQKYGESMLLYVSGERAIDEARRGQCDSSCFGCAYLWGDLVERVSLDGVDSQRVVGMHGSESSGN